MYRAIAPVLFVAMVLASSAPRAWAEDGAPDLLAAASMEDLIIRGQSPAPTQLRVAQTLAAPVDGGYYTAAPSYTQMPAPTTVMPVMDPYATCAPPQPYCPWQPFHLGVFGEFLYLEPRNADVAFAVPQNGIGVPGSAPIGAVAVADPGFSPAFRAGGYFGLGTDARLIATYTYFTSSTDTSLDVAAPGVVNPLVLFPGTFNAGFTAQQATSSYDINFQLIDLDYQVMADACQTYWWGYSLGARYARLEQDFGATFPFNTPDGTTTLNTVSNFTGVGPKAGVEGERLLFPSCGLRAYGKGSATFAVGHFAASYEQNNEFNGTEAITNIRQDRIVPILDFELGLAWLSPGEHVRISGGYMVAAWFNTMTTSGWIGSVQDGTYQPGADTITFDGLTARGEVRF